MKNFIKKFALTDQGAEALTKASISSFCILYGTSIHYNDADRRISFRKCKAPLALFCSIVCYFAFHVLVVR